MLRERVAELEAANEPPDTVDVEVQIEQELISVSTQTNTDEGSQSPTKGGEGTTGAATARAKFTSAAGEASSALPGSATARASGSGTARASGSGTTRGAVGKLKAAANAIAAMNMINSKKGKKEEPAEVKQLSEEALEGWNKWIGKIGVAQVVMNSLQLSTDEEEAFKYVKGLTREKMTVLLEAGNLLGLLDCLMQGIVELQDQAASSASALGERFNTSAKFEMAYGSLDVFFGGLERVLGPPQMLKDPS